MTDPVERVDVGSGTPEGTNGAYVLAEWGVVVDPGPPTDRAWRDLREGIDRAGLALADVEEVLCTHWHADHAGLGPRLADASGATLRLHEDDAPLVADYARERERRLERDAGAMRRWGVPGGAVEAVVSGDEPSPMPDRYPVEPLADGDAVAGLEVLATPGHTLGHAAFVLPAAPARSTSTADDDPGEAGGGSETIFVGDAVLPTYTPNVGGSDTRTTDPLATFRESLDRLADRSARLRPGHGTDVADDRVEAIRAHHRERSRRVRRALADGEPATPWAVATTLFGDLEGIHVKFGAGEAAAHLERLARAGAIRRPSGGPSGDEPIRYLDPDAG